MKTTQKKPATRVLAVLLGLLMLVGICPIGAVVPEAKAAGVSDYSALAAVQWAKDHWSDINSVLFGKGYYRNGGDCANFVSQCLYMGGIDMSDEWNISGYNAHYSKSSNGSWIRAHQLWKYVVSIGGISVQNPSASDVSVGDLLFYKTAKDGKMHHSAIVIDIQDGTPVIAAHSTVKNGVETRYTTKDWHCGTTGSKTYLVKMNGAPCVAPNPRSFDVYTASTSEKLYKSTSASSGYYNTFAKGEYAHVYETKTVGGVEWGKTFRYGSWGWVRLNKFNYQSHQESYRPTHLLGDWYVKKPSSCRENGYEQRDCSRCDYYETRTITGGHKVTRDATCISGSFCDYCGAKITDAVGHSFSAWTVSKAATCTAGGQDKRSCTRCGYTEYRDTSALGHNYSGAVSSAPNCVQNGTSTYKCTRCGSIYTQLSNPNNAWSDWMTADYRSTIPSDRIQTKTQYRYRDLQSTESYATSMSGWTRGGYREVKDSSQSGTNYYINGWHDGFDKSNSLYKKYCNTQKMSSYETETKRVVVGDSEDEAYIFWHWCMGGNYGSINRGIKWYKTGSYTTFHAFLAEHHYDFVPAAHAHEHTESSVCKDTYWWNGLERERDNPITLLKQDYVTYNKLYTYTKWGNWSGWQDSYVGAGNTRQVETRTLYRYNLLALGHNFTVDASYAATCTAPGFSGKKCSRCGASDPNGTVIPAHGHNVPDWNTERSQWYKISADGENPTVYRADCRYNCGYYETKSEYGCQYKKSNTVAPTCTAEGYTVMKCSAHGETMKTDIVPALGHEFDPSLPNDGWITDSAPDCEKTGSKHRDCIRKNACGYSETAVIPANGHDYKPVEAIKPDCINDGVLEHFECGVCHKLFDTDKNETTEEKLVDPAKGHVPGEWVRTKEPGCGCDGWEEQRCTVCNYLLDERAIPGWEHDFQITVDTESTCIEAGYTVYTCTKCGEETSEIKEIAEHSWGEWNITDPLCIYSGEKTRTCSVCGLEDAEEIPAEFTSHDMQTTSASDGCKAFVCSRCGYFEDGSHVFADGIITTAPTCTEDGVRTYVCSVCGKQKTEAVPATGHDYREGEKIEATCTEPGKITMVCANNSEHFYEKITSQPLGHSPEEDAAKAPTCLDTGLSVGYHCAREGCKAVLQSQKTVAALGHDWGEWTVTTDATCTQSGEETRICKRDASHIETRSVKETGHNGGAVEVAEKADCVSDGVKNITCTNTVNGTVCGTVTGTEKIAARGHAWGEWVMTKQPTQTEQGEMTRYCTHTDETEEYRACDAFETKPVDKLGETEIKDEKTAEYDDVTGEARITLSASSEGNSVTVPRKDRPLDIVLVVDMSGSMEKDGKKDKTMNAINEFVANVKKNGEEGNADHRIAIVSFAYGSIPNGRNYDSYRNKAYHNTAIYTTVSGKTVGYADSTDSDYAGALLSINSQSELIDNAISRLKNTVPDGATAASLGFDMAKKIFEQNTDRDGRERIVVFLTDGQPTLWSSFDNGEANKAISIAKTLKSSDGKDACSASVYSIGIFNNEDKRDQNILRFMKLVSSENPTAESMRSTANENPSASYYFLSENASNLSDVFSTIEKASTTYTAKFDDVTLCDTVSKYFTMTTEQEKEMRERLIADNPYLSNDDITVERRADGTTYVEVRGLTPVQNGGTFTASFFFTVSANENALAAGSYVTNTLDAGIDLDGKRVAYFIPPTVTVSEHKTAIFRINGEVFKIVRVDGDSVDAPETDFGDGFDFSGWDTVGYDPSSNCEIFDATLTAKEYTATVNIGGHSYTAKYKAGSLFGIADAKAPDGYMITGWENAPVYMPDRDITVTAILTEHKEHAYTEEITEKPGCLTSGTKTYTCVCGSTYTEEISPLGHNYVGIMLENNGTQKLSFVCTNCMDIVAADAEYTATEVMCGKTQYSVSADSLAGKAVSLWIPKTDYAVSNGDEIIAEGVTAEVRDGMTVVTLTGSATFTVGDNTTNGEHKYGDSTVVKPATCTENGEETAECLICGETVTRTLKATGHRDANNDGSCDSCGKVLDSASCKHICHSSNKLARFLWKIIRFLFKLFRTNQYCACGVKHW